jgi:hypothetical protein
MHISSSAYQLTAYIRSIKLSNVQPKALRYDVSSTVAYVYFDNNVCKGMSEYPEKLVVEYSIYASSCWPQMIQRNTKRT